MLHRAPWLALIAAGQLGLAWVFLERSQVRVGHVSIRTALGWEPPAQDPNSHRDYYLLGSPVPWAGYVHSYRLSDAKGRYDYWTRDGWNPLVPLAGLVLAITLPPALVGLLVQGAGTRSSRFARVLRVVVAASIAGLVAAALAVPTWRDMSAALTQPDAGQRHLPAPSDWEVAAVVRDGEAWPLSPAWMRSTTTTAVGFGIGSFLGCLLFRPWRRGRSLADSAASAVR